MFALFFRFMDINYFGSGIWKTSRSPRFSVFATCHLPSGFPFSHRRTTCKHTRNVYVMEWYEKSSNKSLSSSLLDFVFWCFFFFLHRLRSRLHRGKRSDRNWSAIEKELRAVDNSRTAPVKRSVGWRFEQKCLGRADWLSHQRSSTTISLRFIL